MPASARILIVSNGPLCRNPRVVKEADALGAAGHRVTVLTVRDHAPSEAHDVALLARAPFQRITVDLLPGFGTPGATVFLRRTRLRLARRLARIPAWRSIHSLGPARALLQRARHEAADLVIVHNEIAHWVGTKLLDDGRKVAADFEDWHSEDLLPANRAVRPLAQLRAIEKDLLHRAVHTTTTSAALADALHARYGGRRPVVITNSFPLQPDPRRAPGSPLTFFWFSQTLGPGRGLESFLAAWAKTRNASAVALLGEVQPAYRNQLLAGLPAERRSLVSFLPLVAPDALPAVIARHDVGLALEEGRILNRDLTITNKILQYLNAGLAVVASATTGQREVLVQAPGAGVLVDPGETARFSATLDALLADPSELARSQAAARRAAETVYCWEREAPALLATVDAALAKPIA